MVKRQALDRVGPMDERFFMYYDEIDLCYRIKKAGYKIFYLPDIKVIHYGNKSSLQVPGEVSLWKLKSKLSYFKKHYGSLGIAGLVFNLTLETLLVWAPVSLFRAVFKVPKDLDGIKRGVLFKWGEYKKFITRPEK
jgi:GT2 family glycosyltransferase